MLDLIRFMESGIFYFNNNFYISVQMEQPSLKNVSNCLNIKIYSYLETSGGQSSNLYWNDVHIFNTTVNLTYVAA